MSIKNLDIARMQSSTVGAAPATIALDGIVAGFKTFANAGASDADQIYAGIEQPSTNAREVGLYTYNAAGPSLTRVVVYASTNADLAIVLDGTAQVFSSPITNGVLQPNRPDQLISGGANVTSYALPTGNLTVDCGLCPLQYISNNGAFTVTAPITDGSCSVLVTNTASAGAITFSGFSVGSSTGDLLDTITGHDFTVFVWCINGVSGYRVAAHQ